MDRGKPLHGFVDIRFKSPPTERRRARLCKRQGLTPSVFLFHELSHIEGTEDADKAHDDTGYLWIVQNIDFLIDKPDKYTLAGYLTYLEQKLGTSGCSDNDKRWPRN